MNCKTLAAVLLLVLASAAYPADRPLTVFAASSMTDVMEDIGRAYTAQTGIAVRFSFASSSALARQVESGAPADVFISADQEWMDYLAERGLIEPATRRNVVANTLVLIAPAGSVSQLKVAPGFALAQALGRSGRIATGDPASVPVGRYARSALTRLGVWESVAARLIPADNVRTALNFVARGEAPLGIVYITDARIEPKVRIVDVFPADSHERITYPAAALARAMPDAAGFVQFLGGASALAAFERAGFARP